MLSSAKVGTVLDRVASQPQVEACALMATHGVIYESRESATLPTHDPHCVQGVHATPKLQTRILGLFSSSAWQDLVVDMGHVETPAKWIGAELESYRVAIAPAHKLLVFIACPASEPWGRLQELVLELSKEMGEIVGDFESYD